MTGLAYATTVEGPPCRGCGGNEWRLRMAQSHETGTHEFTVTLTATDVSCTGCGRVVGLGTNPDPAPPPTDPLL